MQGFVGGFWVLEQQRVGGKDSNGKVATVCALFDVELGFLDLKRIMEHSYVLCLYVEGKH